MDLSCHRCGASCTVQTAHYIGFRHAISAIGYLSFVVCDECATAVRIYLNDKDAVITTPNNPLAPR